MKNLKFLSVVTTLLCLNGCNGKDILKSESDDNNNVKVQAQSTLENKLTVSPLSEPNKYTVKLSWIKYPDKIQIFANNEMILEPIDSQNSIEITVTGGDEINYEIKTKDSLSKNVTVFSKNVHIPRDYIISENLTLTEDLSFKGGRLFLLNSSKIQSLSFNINIEVEELISDRVVIETYPNGIKEHYDLNGKSGGQITILAQSASGNLSVKMIGTSGGDGRGSVCPEQIQLSCNASSGGNGGNSGNLKVLVETNNSFVFHVEKENGKGGTAGKACQYNALGVVLQDFMVYGPFTNCQGYGIGRTDGHQGSDGKGEACYKLSSEDAYDCN